MKVKILDQRCVSSLSFNSQKRKKVFGFLKVCKNTEAKAPIPSTKTVPGRCRVVLFKHAVGQTKHRLLVAGTFVQVGLSMGLLSWGQCSDL